MPTVMTSLQVLGSEPIGFTSLDTITYTTTTNRDRLEEVLKLEAARISDPLFGITELEFESERKTVLNESLERCWWLWACCPLRKSL